jgi:hypothetical protein
LQVTAADLSEWRDKFLAAGEASLKARPRDGREAEIIRLKSKVGGLTMDNELLIERISRMETARPFGVIVKSSSLSAACVKWIIYVSVRGHGSLRSRRMDAS